MINREIKVSISEFHRLLNQCMILDILLNNLKSNDYKIDASSESLKKHYDNIHEEVSQTIRTASKKLERIHKQEIKNKQNKR
jgi:histidinol dehydrogenase